MTIVRLPNEELVIHSMIPCDKATCSEIQELGEIKYLIAPNLEHTRFIDQWRQDYPKAIFYAPTDELLKKYSPSNQINNILPFHHDALLCQPINGIPRLQEFAFFHTQSQTLILTDLAFNLGGEISLWGKIFLRMNGAYNRFTPTRLLKSLIKDKAAFSHSIQTIAKWDFQQIIIAHGKPITQDARNTFERAYDWVL